MLQVLKVMCLQVSPNSSSPLFPEQQILVRHMAAKNKVSSAWLLLKLDVAIGLSAGLYSLKKGVCSPLVLPPFSTTVMECRGLQSYIESCGQKQHRAGKVEHEERRCQSFWQHDRAEMLYHLGPFCERKNYFYLFVLSCSVMSNFLQPHEM